MVKQIRGLFATMQAKVSFMALACFLAIGGAAFAADPVATDTSSVTSTFDGMKTMVLTVIGSVAAAAVAVMGIILAWKYGRKLFGMLAK